jgi:phospholipid/cholesterol/gamma-HCH transport system permease protein
VIERAITAVGAGTRRRFGRWSGRIRFVGALARSTVRYPPTTRAAGVRILINQLRFTAVQALPFLGVIALVIGLAVIAQASAQAVRFGFTDVLGLILTTVVVRELGPLLTAIVVLGRSGTAIAAELATNGVLRETEALESMGVDPLQYLVVPRVVGAAISVAILTIFFDAVALGGGALFAWWMAEVPPAALASAIRDALTPLDLWLTVVKGGIFGAGIAVLCAYEGLVGGRRPTDIPQCVTRGVVASLLFVFMVSMSFSVLFWLVLDR